MTEFNIGKINGDLVAAGMKEMVRRAISIIRTERATFVATTKQHYSGSMDDVFTSADTKAQAMYVKKIQEYFPDAGIIGEEVGDDGKNLWLSPKNDCHLFFTIDPLDGTKAFVRKQSHGVSTMIALVDYTTQVVHAAYIGDINTREVYGYRPGSTKAHRIIDLDYTEQLVYTAPSKYALLRDTVEKYSDFARDFITDRFRLEYKVEGSSIGTWCAQLWKREVGVVMIPKGFETPWDSSPVVGISKKLGYIFLKADEVAQTWVPYEPHLSKEVYKREHDTLIIHENDLHLLA